MVDVKRGGFLGVRYAQDRRPIMISHVVPQSAADVGGLRQGDILLRIDQTETGAPEDLKRVLADKAVGDEMTIRFRRAGRESQITVRLGPWY